MIHDLDQYDAVIYDMDGVLTDSEPLWKIAMEEVFAGVGCNLTREDFQQTVGLRIDEVVVYWYTVSPWENVAVKEVENRIIQRMIELLSERATPLPGVLESLEYFRSKGKRIGLATSSYEVLITTILKTLGIRDYFQAIPFCGARIVRETSSGSLPYGSRTFGCFPSKMPCRGRFT